MILVLAWSYRAVMDWARRHRLHSGDVVWLPPDEPHLASQRLRGLRQPNLVRLDCAEAHPEVEALLKHAGAVEVPEAARTIKKIDNTMLISPDVWDTLDRKSDRWRRRHVTDVPLPGDGKEPGSGVAS